MNIIYSVIPSMKELSTYITIITKLLDIELCVSFDQDMVFI